MARHDLGPDEYELDGLAAPGVEPSLRPRNRPGVPADSAEARTARARAGPGYAPHRSRLLVHRHSARRASGGCTQRSSAVSRRLPCARNAMSTMSTGRTAHWKVNTASVFGITGGEQLSGDLPVTELPTDRPRRQAQTYRGAVHRFTIDTELTAGLKDDRPPCGSDAVHDAARGVRHAAAPIQRAGRPTDRITVRLPGRRRDSRNWSATLPIRWFCVPICTATRRSTTLLGRIKQTVLGALRHQDYPFALLVERLRPVRDPSHAPLFQVSFAWEQFRRFHDGPNEFGLRPEVARHDVGPHRPGRCARRPDDAGRARWTDELICALQYNTDLFDRATIERMAGHFTTLLRGLVADPDKRLSELPLLTEAEKLANRRRGTDAGRTTTLPTACTRWSRKRLDAIRPQSR